MFQSNFLCISYVPKGYTVVLMFNKLCFSKLLWLATQHVTPRYVCVIALHDVVWCVLNKSRVQLMGRFVICFKLCFKIGCVFLSKSCCYLNILLQISMSCNLFVERFGKSDMRFRIYRSNIMPGKLNIRYVVALLQILRLAIWTFWGCWRLFNGGLIEHFEFVFNSIVKSRGTN